MKIFNIALGEKTHYDKFKYPAGEMQVRLSDSTQASVVEADAIAVTARVSSPEDIIELSMLCSALRSSSSRKSIKLVLPYLPYARADRRFVEGDCAGLDVFAGVINSLNVEVFTLDAHSARSGEVINQLTDLAPTSFIDKAINESKDPSANLGEQLTLLFPDEGARKRYSKIKTDPPIDILHCAKKRNKENGKLSGFIVPPSQDFKSKHVLLVDDICDGGGTFLGIAEALVGYDLHLSLYITHGIFSKGPEILLKHFSEIFTTDSLHTDFRQSNLHVYQTAEFFQVALHSSDSIISQ